MPKAPNKPVRKNPKKPKSKTTKDDKSKTKKGAAAALAALSMFLALPATADVGAYPYVQLGVEHLQSLDRWSNNGTLGVDVTSGHIYFNPRFTIHDFWKEKDTEDPVPWDQTVEVSLGLFLSDYSMVGVDTSPFIGALVAHPNGPDAFSVGMEAGLELAFDRFYGVFDFKARDIFTNEADQVYPWDTSVGVAIGLYFQEKDEAAGKGKS